MRIVVCVKHVPDMQSERRFEGGRLVRGEDDVLNELDENAIEAAVQLKESEEDAGREAEVVALTMGPEDAEDSLMRALQMGADRAWRAPTSSRPPPFCPSRSRRSRRSVAPSTWCSPAWPRWTR